MTNSFIGHVLDGKYRIEMEIGAGGMGRVFRGRHLLLGNYLAIKMLRPDLAQDSSAARRFAQEARGSFLIDHPHCVRVFDFGYDVSLSITYLVMEYLDGRTIRQELAVDGAFDAARVAAIIAKTADAVANAHSLGIIHRDLKPENVVLLRRGDDGDYPKVLDFGLAKLTEPDSAGSTLFSMGALTQDGKIFGTPEYMSPEQALGQTVTRSSDVYSLGVMAFEMSTGRLPFTGTTSTDVLRQQVESTPPSPAAINPRLPSTVVETILSCLAKSPDARPSASQLSARLRAPDTVHGIPRSAAGQQTVDLGTAIAIPPGTRRNRTTLIVSVVVMLGVALIFGLVTALRRTGPRSGEREATTSRNAPDASDAARRPDAAPDAALRLPIPARPKRRRNPTQPTRSTTKREPAPSPLSQRLAESRAAQKSGHTLKQLSKAHAALRLAPKHKEAHYLLGDALLKSGDKANGCRHLRIARSLRRAQQRAQAAGC